jgi:hypothetical protein
MINLFNITKVVLRNIFFNFKSHQYGIAHAYMTSFLKDLSPITGRCNPRKKYNTCAVAICSSPSLVSYHRFPKDPFVRVRVLDLMRSLLHSQLFDVLTALVNQELIHITKRA